MRIRTEEQIIEDMRKNSTDDDPTGIKYEIGRLRQRIAALQLKNTRDRIHISCYDTEPLIPTEVKAVVIVMICFIALCCFLIR